jgi:probable rRNA maturation factor
MTNLKIGLAFVGDKKMQELNKTYRKIDEPTDVLSFPYNEDLPDGTYFLGEVVVNVDQIKNEGELIEKFVHGLKNLLKEKNC